MSEKEKFCRIIYKLRDYIMQIQQCNDEYNLYYYRLFTLSGNNNESCDLLESNKIEIMTHEKDPFSIDTIIENFKYLYYPEYPETIPLFSDIMVSEVKDITPIRIENYVETVKIRINNDRIKNNWENIAIEIYYNCNNSVNIVEKAVAKDMNEETILSIDFKNDKLDNNFEHIIRIIIALIFKTDPYCHNYNILETTRTKLSEKIQIDRETLENLELSRA